MFISIYWNNLTHLYCIIEPILQIITTCLKLISKHHFKTIHTSSIKSMGTLVQQKCQDAESKAPQWTHDTCRLQDLFFSCHTGFWICFMLFNYFVSGSELYISCFVSLLFVPLSYFSYFLSRSFRLQHQAQKLCFGGGIAPQGTISLHKIANSWSDGGLQFAALKKPSFDHYSYGRNTWISIMLGHDSNWMNQFDPIYR